jgi:anti-sigma factor RsiW
MSDACERWEALLEERLEGSETPEGRRELEAHLSGCARCREAFADALAATQMLREAALEPAGEPAPYLGARLAAELRAGVRQGSGGQLAGDFWEALERLALRWAFVTAMALVLLTGYVLTVDRPWQSDDLAAQSELREIFTEPAVRPADDAEILVRLTVGEGR